MKPYISILLLLLVACNPTRHNEQKDYITVSILPQKYFIERIAGDLVNINVLVPPGASPATYSLVPSQLKDIAKSKAWFRMDYLGFELSWTNKISSANPDMKLFSLSKGIELIRSEDEDHGDHHHEGGIDPHFWMAPHEVAIIAQNTFMALKELYPEQEQLFQKNFQQLMTDINEIDAHVKSALDQITNRSFLVFHPSLTYFARQYGLQQIAIENMGKEPSAKHVKEIVQMAKEKNIRCIFIQKEFNQENAQTIADEIGGKVIPIDPLHYNWIEQMEETTKNLQIALH